MDSIGQQQSRTKGPGMTYEVGDEPVPGYRLVAFVGRGNSGDVWKALGPGRVVVALKIIPLDSKLGRRERKAILGLRNFNDNALVNIYGLWFKDRAGQILEYSEELEDDAPSVRPEQLQPQAKASDPAPKTGIGRPPAPRDSQRAPVVPSPGYLGQTIDPEAELAAIETSDSSSHDATSDSNDHSLSDTNRNSSGTATGSGSFDPGGRSSAKNATELVVAMTLGDMTLGDRLEECQRSGETGIPLKELQRLMRDAARGIDYLNIQHFQHCDIKPENILIVGSGAKICDFGLARPTKLDPGVTQTSNGFTWACAAPEQLQHGHGIQNFSDHTDQYSLATAYYRLRTGRFPFDENSLDDLIRRKRDGKLDLSSKVLGKRERMALAKALETQPTSRYPTATDFVETLERATAPETGSSVRTFAVGVTMALLLAVVAVGGWLAYETWVPSKAFTSLQTAVASDDIATAVAAYPEIKRERERRQGEELLLDRLQQRLQDLTAEQCADLDQLLKDSAAVANVLEGRAQENAQAFLTQVEDQRSQTIPATVRAQLARYLDRQDFTAAQEWSQSELPVETACDQAVLQFVRDEIVRKWLAKSENDAQGEHAAAVLKEWPKLAEYVQETGRSDYQDRADRVKKLALRSTRQNALAMLATNRAADWDTSYPLWETLVQNGDLETTQGRDDKLAWLVARLHGDPTTSSDDIQLELDTIPPPADEKDLPARWRWLRAYLTAAKLKDESPATTDTTQALVDSLLAIREQPEDTIGRPLTSWEQTKNDEMVAQLDMQIAQLAPDAQTVVLGKFEKLKAGAGLNLRIEQLRRLLAQGDLVAARELLAKSEPEFTEPAAKARFAEIKLWADLQDKDIAFPDTLPILIGLLPNPAGGVDSELLLDTAVERAIHAGVDSAEFEYAIEQFTALQMSLRPPLDTLDRALARLIGYRLATHLPAADDPAKIQRDAIKLLELRDKLNEAETELPWPVIAAAWVEAQSTQGHRVEQDPAAKKLDILTLAKRPLTSQQREQHPQWGEYVAWVNELLLSPENKPLSIEDLSKFYADKANSEVLQAPHRRSITAHRALRAIPSSTVISDKQIPLATTNTDLTKLASDLKFAYDLLQDTPGDVKNKAHLAATLAIVDYYARVQAKVPPKLTLELADSLLADDAARQALAATGNTPGLINHLNYVRARAYLATSPKTPQDEGERLAAVQQAATALESSFDFVGFQRSKNVDAQADADMDVYFSLVVPALKFASPKPDAEEQAALAIIHAAQARIIERSSGVRSRLLREPGMKLKSLFEKQRDSYAWAAQWEPRPEEQVRNSLHQINTLLDWHGSRAPEVRQTLPKVIARCEAAQPDSHITHYLQGMQHLYHSRDEGRDLCNIAHSAAVQRNELDLAEKSLKLAIASPTLSAQQKLEYLPRYYVGLSSVNLERAFIRTSVDEKVPILQDALAQADLAIKAANEHPLKLFLDQAYLAQGNPNEDLALHCGRTQHFNDSEQSFKNGQTAAGSGWLQAEASFNLGRAQLRNALRTIPRSEGERLVAKLMEAEASLIDARDNLPKLDKPHLLIYAAEANIHLAGVYMELAEFYAGRKEIEKATPYIALADKAYADAVAGAVQYDRASWGNYQATWLRRALKRWRSQRAAGAVETDTTRKLIERIANELVTAANKNEYPIDADDRALAIQALLDINETPEIAPLLTELRAGRLPRNMTAEQIASMKKVLEAKQKKLQELIGVFGTTSCDDMTMAALGLLFDLHQQCSRLSQFAGVREYCGQEVTKVSDRLKAMDWKKAYAKSMATGFRGLAAADPLLIGLPRDQRKSKTVEFQVAAQGLIQAIEGMQQLAQEQTALADKGIIDEDRSTVAFRLALAELMLEINDFVPKTSRSANAVKPLATSAKKLLQESLGRPTLSRHQRVFESALGQLDTFLE